MNCRPVVINRVSHSMHLYLKPIPWNFIKMMNLVKKNSMCNVDDLFSSMVQSKLFLRTTNQGTIFIFCYFWCSLRERWKILENKFNRSWQDNKIEIFGCISACLKFHLCVISSFPFEMYRRARLILFSIASRIGPLCSFFSCL